MPRRRSTCSRPDSCSAPGRSFRNDQFVSGSLQLSLPLYAGGGITAGIAAARSGTVSRSDLLPARVALANAEQGRPVDANDLMLAEADYNRVLGEPLERVPHLAAQLPVDRSLASLPLEKLIARALAGRSELQALTARVQALDARARAELAALRPQAALSGAYTHYDNLRMALELYRAGMGTNTRVLEAVALRTRATGNFDNAELHRSLALLKLAYAVGAF